MTLIEDLLEWFETSESERLFPTLPWDSVPWEVTPTPQSIIAIGDLQGDIEALASILLERQMINPDGAWIGGGRHVVLLGDLVGGHPDSRLLLDFVIRLEGEAQKQGGQVHALLGNHDILMAQGEGSKLLKLEKKLFEKYLVRGAPEQSFEDLFRGESLYAQWFRSRNSILKMGSSLFVHAGINGWLLENSPGAVNATVRAWIRFWQGIGEKPPKRTRWTVGKKEMDRDDPFLAAGPLWTRVFKASKDRPSDGPTKKVLQALLETYQTSRLVIGHAPTEDQRIVLEHPHYGASVVMLDTQISHKSKGMLSSLEIVNDQLMIRYTERSVAARSIREHELEKLKTGRSIHHPNVLERAFQSFSSFIHRNRP